MPDGLCGVLCHPGRHPVGDYIGDHSGSSADQHHTAPQKDEGDSLLRDDVIDHVGENPGEQEIHNGSNKFYG